MSHLIDTMAYTGQTPWHQLGHALPKKQSIDVWAQAAGMQWKIQETPVRYMATGDADALYGEALEFPEQKVLYRSDTNAALSVVSQRYKVVQPQEVLEFYRDLSEVAGFELETAGVLKAGRRFWALARTGKSTCLKGNDVVHSYLLLATSCDGTPTSPNWSCGCTKPAKAISCLRWILMMKPVPCIGALCWSPSWRRRAGLRSCGGRGHGRRRCCWHCARAREQGGRHGRAGSFRRA